MSLPVFPSNVRGLTYPVLKSSEFNTLLQAAPNLLETSVAQSYNPMWRWSLVYEFLFDDPNNLVSGLTSPDYRVLQGFLLAQGGRAFEFLYTDPTDHAVGPALIAGSPNPLAQLQLVSDATNPISAAVVGSSAGTGFAVGDYLAVAGGAGGVLKVASLSGSAIASFIIVSPGSGYTTTTGAVLSVLTGSGSGSPTANITAVTVYYSPIQRNFGGQFYEDITDLNGTITVYANAVLKTLGTDYTIVGPGLAIPGYSFMGLVLKWAAMPTGPINAAFSFYFRVRFANDKQDFTQFLNQFWTVAGSESSGGVALELKSSRPVQV